MYAPQREIYAYLEATAVKYGVMRFVKLSHNVESCKWDEAAKKWYARRPDSDGLLRMLSRRYLGCYPLNEWIQEKRSKTMQTF